MCPGLFPGVTPFRRAGGAHVVPETLGLHIPVVRIAHGTSREPSGLLTLHVPYNGREYCRSQLEAHSFSYKPVPTTDEDGMRFHVVYDSSTPVRRRHLAGADAKDRYAIIRLVGMAGVSSPDIADSASPPRFHPRYCLARKPRKSPSTLSAFAMFDQESSGGAPATNRHNPYSINPGLLDPRRRGLNGCCMSGEFLLLVVNPAPQPLPKTPVSNQNFKLRTRGAAVEPPDI